VRLYCGGGWAVLAWVHTAVMVFVVHRRSVSSTRETSSEFSTAAKTGQSTESGNKGQVYHAVQDLVTPRQEKRTSANCDGGRPARPQNGMTKQPVGCFVL